MAPQWCYSVQLVCFYKEQTLCKARMWVPLHWLGSWWRDSVAAVVAHFLWHKWRDREVEREDRSATSFVVVIRSSGKREIFSLWWLQLQESLERSDRSKRVPSLFEKQPTERDELCRALVNQIMYNDNTYVWSRINVYRMMYIYSLIT